MTAKPTQAETVKGVGTDLAHPQHDAELLRYVIKEGVRQAKLSANQAYWSFSAAIVMTSASALIGLIGAGMVLLNRASEGSVTAAVGFASGVYSYQLSKEAAERQQQANARLDQMLVELQQPWSK